MTDTVGTVINKVERVRWENYLREFENKEFDIKELYWNCVVSDFLNIQDDSFESTAFKTFSERFFKSYIGCFYKAHEVFHKLLQQFESLHNYHKDSDGLEWENWKHLLLKEKHNSMVRIRHMIASHYKPKGSIKKTNTLREFPVYIFDSNQKYLAQNVSSLIIPHIQNGLYPNPASGTDNTAFQFKISSDLISELQKLGHRFASSLMILRAIRKVDQHFEVQNSPIKAYPEMSPSKAIDDLLGKFPEYKDLTASQLTYLIQVKYRDQKGQMLKRDSISKTLRRRGHKN